MEPNSPTKPRRFGTDASLDWPAQLDIVKEASSMAVTRLKAQLSTAVEASEVTEIVRALATAQQLIRREMGSNQEEQEPELSEQQIARAIKK